MSTDRTFQDKEHKILYTEYKTPIPLPNYILHKQVHDTKAGMSFADHRPSGYHYEKHLSTGLHVTVTA